MTKTLLIGWWPSYPCEPINGVMVSDHFKDHQADYLAEDGETVRGRAAFAFSDVRRLLAEAALHPDFQSLCPPPTQSPQNPFVRLLLRMVA